MGLTCISGNPPCPPAQNLCSGRAPCQSGGELAVAARQNKQLWKRLKKPTNSAPQCSDLSFDEHPLTQAMPDPLSFESGTLLQSLQIIGPKGLDFPSKVAVFILFNSSPKKTPHFCRSGRRFRDRPSSCPPMLKAMR